MRQLNAMPVETSCSSLSCIVIGESLENISYPIASYDPFVGILACGESFCTGNGCA